MSIQSRATQLRNLTLSKSSHKHKKMKKLSSQLFSQQTSRLVHGGCSGGWSTPIVRHASNSLFPKEHLESFELYNKMNAKFRVAVVNTCNMNCYFCHNEGMANPRSAGDAHPLKKQGPEPFPIQEVIRVMNDFCELGGTQLNITGGEPLVRKDIVSVLKSIDKKKTRIVLNSNILLAERLLR